MITVLLMIIAVAVAYYIGWRLGVRAGAIACYSAFVAEIQEQQNAVEAYEQAVAERAANQ